MPLSWGLRRGNSTVPTPFRGIFQPNEGSLPSGRAVTAMGKILIRPAEGAFAAAIDPLDSEAGEPAPRKCRQIGKKSAARIRREPSGGLRVFGQHEVAPSPADLEMPRADRRPEPG